MEIDWWGVALGVAGIVAALVLMRVAPRKYWDDSRPRKGDPDPYDDVKRRRY
ncbi:hypothetical protein GCM10027456_09040 [Kineosporia babensis]